MHFNFVLANHRPAALQALDDVLRPLFLGLRALGHRVTAPARQLRRAPLVNLVVEDFSDPGFARMLTEARAGWGDDLRLGVVCPFGLDGPTMTAARRGGLRAAAHVLDFAWTLAPDQLPPGLLPPDRIAVLGYGFHESMAGPRLISDAQARDIDVVVYAPDHERIGELTRRLAAAGLGHFVLRAGALPDYLVTDILSRGKVAVAIGDRRDPPRCLLPRAVKAVCNGTLPLTEPGSVDGPLADVVPACAYDDMPARCAALIAGGQFAALGLEALERLKASTMGSALAAALAVPALRRGEG